MSNNLKVISEFVKSDKVKNQIVSSLGEQQASMFQTSLITVINSNELLKDATIESVYAAVLLSASVGLPINNNLGYAYIVPFKRKIKTDQGEQYITEAQFQLGYKGIIQLAHRSNLFKLINASEIKEGELKSINRQTGEFKFEFEQDYEKRNNLKTTGFIAHFELTNGFYKTLYMSLDEINKHKLKYSKTGRSAYGVWVDNFDEMAKKTVLKLLLLRYAPLSLEQQEVLIKDQSVMDTDLNATYVDNTKELVIETVEPIILDGDE